MELNQSGFITNYLISGPRTRDFISHHNDDNQLRYEQYLRTIVAEACDDVPAAAIKLGSSSDIGQPWEYYYSYGNWFVDKSVFYSTLQKVDLDGVTELFSTKDQEIEAVFWTYGAMTVWCNDEKVCGIESPVYKPIQRRQNRLRLKAGVNRIYIRLQTLGVRDTRTLFGIQLPGNPAGIQVTLPDWEHVGPIYEQEKWLAGMEMKNSQLFFLTPAPAGSMLGYNNKSPDYGDKGKRIIWESVAGKTAIQLDKNREGNIHIMVTAGKTALTRVIENIEAQIPVYGEMTDFTENKKAIFQRIADTRSLSRGDKFGFAIANILARKALNKEIAADKQLLWETLDQIERRYDCSDFLLCGMIRYMKNYPLDKELADRAKAVLLDYRYWMDQDGTDGMCFWSENHSLMFYTCAMNVGEMYPEEYFKRAGMAGHKLYQEGRKKVIGWLTDVEEHGFEEFLSTVYMCVTFAALLNVIDFSDEEISLRAVKVTDTLLEMLARHTFDGAVLAPMGRVYREVIHPFQQGAQALMNLLNPQVPYTYGEGWLGFYATSKYEIPLGFAELMGQPVRETYETGNALICLVKEEEYCLTSVQSPRMDAGFVRWENLTLKEGSDTKTCEYTKSLNERFHGTTCFEPGVYGYQQHMWYGVLDMETNVFTNHPGGSCEESAMRPGFWYGNGVMPAISQQQNQIGVVYHIPEAHPLHFTHAYFPSVKFTEQIIEENWLFGKKKKGYLALWCSQAMEPVADQLFGCEYRSYGDDIAYYCLVAKAEDYKDFADFISRTKANPPTFSRNERRLIVKDLSVTFVQHEDRTQFI